MATPTTLSVSVDNVEYSRYEPGRDTITVSVVANGGAPYASNDVLVELTKDRRSRDAVVAADTITLASATDPETQTVTFYLPDVVDQDLINLVRHGKYFVRATSLDDDTIIGESETFDISLVTVDKLKKTWLFGIDLKATEIRAPKFQPQVITGVTIEETSEAHPVGFGTLQLTYSDVTPMLSWNGGTAVPVATNGTYILRYGGAGPACGLGVNSSQDYICVKVVAALLPAAPGATEEILIAKDTLSDDVLRDYLCQSTRWLEEIELAIYLEPTNVVTDRDPTTIQYSAGVQAPTPIFTDTDFDYLVSPLTYFVQRSETSWVHIQFPYPQILRVDSLFGSIANTRVIDIDLEWIEISQQGGLVQLVPFNQEIAFDFLGLLWVNALRGAQELPNFWHFNAIVGLREAPCDLLEVIGKKAAIDALTVAGMALRPGVGSLSLSRDGVSESVSYTTQSQYGVYTGTISAYKDWITESLQKYKGKYRGPTLAVV